MSKQEVLALLKKAYTHKGDKHTVHEVQVILEDALVPGEHPHAADFADAYVDWYYSGVAPTLDLVDELLAIAQGGRA
jgi:hypothetical protein